MMKVKIFLFVLFCCCLMATEVSADDRFQHIRVNGTNYQNNSSLFQGENVEFNVYLVKDYGDHGVNVSYDEKFFLLTGEKEKDRDRYFYFSVLPNAKGKTEIGINLLSSSRDSVLGTDYLSFNIKKPYNIELEAVISDSSNENSCVNFYAKTGLSKIEEEELGVKFYWSFYGGEIPFSQTFSNKERGVSLKEGFYEGSLTVIDKLNRVYSVDFSFIVEDTERSDEVIIDTSHIPRTCTVGKEITFDFSGSYFGDDNISLNIYIKGKEDPIVKGYYPSKGHLPVYSFEDPGKKEVTVVAKMFGSNVPLKTVRFTINVVENTTKEVKEGGRQETSSPSKTETESDSVRKWEEKVAKEEAKKVPGFGATSAVSVLLTLTLLIRSRI